jgi:hypothetical protein
MPMKKALFFVLTPAFFACEKTENTVTLTYHMTQCGDPWMMSADYAKDKEGTLKKFLAEKGVNVLTLKINTDCGTAAVCLACICKGCDTATVDVPEDDVADMEALKFVKK